MLDSLISLVPVIVPAIVSSNVFMALVKKFFAYVQKKPEKGWLRGLLAIFSAISVIVMAAASGDAVDYNQVSDLLTIGGTALATALGAHMTYKVNKW